MNLTTAHYDLFQNKLILKWSKAKTIPLPVADNVIDRNTIQKPGIQWRHDDAVRISEATKNPFTKTQVEM